MIADECPGVGAGAEADVGGQRDTTTVPPRADGKRLELIADRPGEAERTSNAGLSSGEHGASFEPPTPTLADLEVVIEKAVSSFIVDAGGALRTIRDQRMYYRTHSSFDAYLRERWDLDRRYANRLIEAHKVAMILGSMGPKITSERQARELAPLLDQPEALRKVWKSASAPAKPL